MNVEVGRRTGETLLSAVMFAPAGRPAAQALYAETDGATRTGPTDDPAGVRRLTLSRDSATLAAEAHLSLATYFNAFPASYWAHSTPVRQVRLTVHTTGTGDVAVYRSDGVGTTISVSSRTVAGDMQTEFDLPLDGFEDGGWYWFDLTAGIEPLRVHRAWWGTDVSPRRPDPSTTIAITTVNRAAYCLPLLEALAGDPDLMRLVAEIVVVDQGTQKLTASSRFAAVHSLLGDRLRVIEQANLGGSGGFARGMSETLASGHSSAVLLLDDDIAAEPEAIRRAIVFGSYTRTPTLVGGQMLDLNVPSVLHAGAEEVELRSFMWRAKTPTRHDFAVAGLRSTTWLHSRWDAGYNGWWMCLIPIEALTTVGLALPVFIKWDDAEYGLRAAAAGFPTVTLPGSAVWHIAWVDKDDSRDWQAFYHARNRLVAALLHAPFRAGGRLPLLNLALDVRYLLTMDYYTAHIRQLAYRSVLAGPERLHAELGTRIGQLRALAAQFPEAQLHPTELTHLAPAVLPPRSVSAARPGALTAGLLALRSVLRHAFLPPAAGPWVRLGRRDAHWWVALSYDRLEVENADGSHYSRYLRRPKAFRRLMRQSLMLNLRLTLGWAPLTARYRARLAEISSDATWRRTFSE